MRKSGTMSCSIILLGLLAFNSHAANRSVGDTQFAAIKSLVGSWQGYKEDEKGQTVVLSYELSGGGNTVIEKLFKGTPKEMVTAYHRNGDKLVMTHYCMLGNQPRMSAVTSADDKKIEFRFMDGTNMNAGMDAHMHDLTLTLTSANQLKHEWVMYDAGKRGPTTTFIFSRK